MNTRLHFLILLALNAIHKQWKLFMHNMQFEYAALISDLIPAHVCNFCMFHYHLYVVGECYILFPKLLLHSTLIML
jgi:hypothetical protein